MNYNYEIKHEKLFYTLKEKSVNLSDVETLITETNLKTFHRMTFTLYVIKSDAYIKFIKSKDKKSFFRIKDWLIKEHPELLI
jgi:hypothetical protein